MLLFKELCSGKHTWIVQCSATFAAPNSPVPPGASYLVSTCFFTASTFQHDATHDLMVCTLFSIAVKYNVKGHLTWGTGHTA